jgi:hypothetical protein
MTNLWRLLLILTGCASNACQNPVNSQRKEALGPEQAGVRNGPLHRPGQPCTVCHSSGGGAPDFSLAGTVFAAADSTQPLVGAVVQVVENGGSQRLFTTNAAGNFFVSSNDWSPDFPLWSSVVYYCGDVAATYVHADMQTQIFRAASCADCHFDPVGSSSAGHIYLSTAACP